MQNPHRELTLKTQSEQILQDPHLLMNALEQALLPLAKVTLIIDTLISDNVVNIIKEFLKNELTIFSDVLPDATRWCEYNEEPHKFVLADFQHSSRLYPFQWLNFVKLLESDHLIILSNELFAPQLLPYLGSDVNIIDLPFFTSFKEEVFYPDAEKITKALQIIQQEKRQDIAIYCENLHQMDQLYQALYFHGELDNHQIEIHQVLPAEPFYEKYVTQLQELAYPKIEASRKVYLASNYETLSRYLLKQQHSISTIIHMGFQRTIRKYISDIKAIAYKDTLLTKIDILLRNKIAYFPKVIYMYSENEFVQLPQGELIDEEEFEFNQETLYTRAKNLNLLSHLKHIEEQQEVEEQFYKCQLPFQYYLPLLEAENETFNYYCHMISTLLTEGEILSQGNLDSKKNPLKSFTVGQNREALIRSNHYWSKMGDITSWIQLINKFIIFIEDQIQLDEQIEIENTEANYQQKRKAQNDLIRWCRNQYINIPKFILILAYNEYIHDVTECYRAQYSIINKIGSLEDLKLNRTLSLKKQQSTSEHSEDIQIYVLRLFYVGLCVFSGHKSAGYHNYQSNKTFKLCYNNIMSLIGDYPLTCIVVALNQTQSGSYEIKFSTKIDDIIISQIAPPQFVKQHKLSFIKRQSLHLSEMTFSNIGQVLFNELWKSQQGPKVSQECIIQPNMDLNLIQVLYDQNQVDGGKIKKEIEDQIETLKKQFQSQVKEMPYENDSKFIMEAGGKIKLWIEKSAYKTFFIEGLPLDVTQESLTDFFEEVEISEIKLTKEGELITARVTLSDHEDLEWCLENIHEFNGTKVKVYHQHDQYEQVSKSIKFQESFFVELSWNIHINKGFVHFEIENQEDIQEDITIAGQQYKCIKLSEGNYKIDNLDLYVTENDIREGLKTYNLKDITLEKRFRYENNGELQLEIRRLLFEFKDVKNHHQDIWHFKVISFEKVENRRFLLLEIPDKKYIEQFIKLDNQIKTFRGMQIKLKVNPILIHNFEGAMDMKQVIQEVFQENNVSNILSNNSKSSYEMTTDIEENKLFVKVITHNFEEHVKLNIEISKASEPKKIGAGTIKINDQDFDINSLFSATGSKFLRTQADDLQILIKQDYINNQILVNSSNAKFDELIKRITEFGKDCTKYIINIPKAAIKMIMGIDCQGLNKIKQDFDLKSVKFNSASGELTLYGDQRSIDFAQVSISEMISQQQLAKPVDAICCNYCFDAMKNGYMLQGCGHKFCLQCIMFSVQNSLGDMNQLPIRCPQCNQALLLADMHILLDEASWEKLGKLAINKFVQDNAAEMNFCITPNCPMIYFNKIPRYTCSKCEKIYCNTCKTAFHYGQTCREFKAGGDESINLYMKKHDIRRCPHCKVMIQRIDGCYRVTCTGCKKSICWKMNKENKPCMAIFETASESYAHLTKEHGGYW